MQEVEISGRKVMIAEMGSTVQYKDKERIPCVHCDNGRIIIQKSGKEVSCPMCLGDGKSLDTIPIVSTGQVVEIQLWVLEDAKNIGVEYTVFTDKGKEVYLSNDDLVE